MWRDDETFGVLNSLFENPWGRDMKAARLVAVEFQGQLAGRLEPLKVRAARVLERLRDSGRMVNFFERIAALQREGRSFAVATVVGRRAPVSAHLGDRAIVFADGRMEGFVGGACSREIVRKQALEVAARRGTADSCRFDRMRARRRVDRRARRRADDVCVGRRRGRVRRTVRSGAPSRRRRRDARRRRAGARWRAASTTRSSRVVDAREQRDIEAEAAALGVTVATLDALERFSARQRGRRRGRRRVAGALRRGGARSELSGAACRTSAWSRRARVARP